MSGEAIVTALLAAAAALVWSSNGWWARQRLHRAMPPSPNASAPGAPLRIFRGPGRSYPSGRWLLPASFGLAGLGGLGLLMTAGPVPVIGAALVLYALRARRARAVRARVAARREAALEFTASLASEMRGGRTPPGAFVAAVSGLPPGELRAELAAAATAAEAGTDFVPLVAVVAGQPGAAGLRRVAACLRLSLAGGAGLAPALDRVAAGLRDEEAVRREIAAQLAGPRATARLLAVLPVFGLVLGTGLGAEPLPLLVGTPLGLAALGVGAALAAAGWLWTDRLARGVEALA